MKKTLHIYRYGYRYGKRNVPYFESYFLPDWDIVYNSPTPHIVFFSSEGALSKILDARIKFGWRPLLCMRHGEAWLPSNHLIDYSFSFAPTDSKNCCTSGIPGRIRNLFTPDKACDPSPKIRNSGFSSPNDFNTKHSLSTRAKTNFCNFVYSATRFDRKVREDFCKLLMEYKKVDCPGAVLNNMKRIRKWQDKGAEQAKLKFISSYKFTIAFENTSTDYYITEKIFHPLMVGSIPIYWGCPKIEEYINPNAIINCHNYNSFNEVIERVKEIDNNPALYQQYINAKPILPNSRFYHTERELKQRVQHIATEALERGGLPKINKLANLWKLPCFIWQNRNALFIDFNIPPMLRQNTRRRKLILLVRNIKRAIAQGD